MTLSADMRAELDVKRTIIRSNYLADEVSRIDALLATNGLSDDDLVEISKNAETLIKTIRTSGKTGLMEQFLAEYGLSTKEGVALMCLAEALLRVPDARTIDQLIRDKIAPGEWSRHLGRSASSLVNASTWALMLTGKVLTPGEDQGVASVLHSLVKRLGEPVVREATGVAMKQMGQQFVLGRTIEEARQNGLLNHDRRYRYSYDMLGEAARTDEDAQKYFRAYHDAITHLAGYCKGSVRDNPGISVKLSALHPRYEYTQRDRVMADLLPRARELALAAAKANMGFNIDAEEADRLDLSLDVIEALLADPKLEGWDGFGVVVQAYGPRGEAVIDWLHSLAEAYDRRIMVRLVKGAYWDTEIKRAQTLGLAGFPVFTRKIFSDVSYLVCAQKLFAVTDRIYPQFATHNAHSIAAIQYMGRGKEDRFEVQRLHGMGESLHAALLDEGKIPSRIYAPVGNHRDLLAYLVRRLLENGANNSFVNQIVNKDLPAENLARCPITELKAAPAITPNHKIVRAEHLFGASRINSKGVDWTDPVTIEALTPELEAFKAKRWASAPTVRAAHVATPQDVVNPADPTDVVGTVLHADTQAVDVALDIAQSAARDWADEPVEIRARLLEAAADKYEEMYSELMALAIREAGKTIPDAIAEVREAVDFLRYYADQARQREGGRRRDARGVFVCISPWNFPLAIFTGQIAAALVTGNAVIAKPAEQTPLIAALAVDILHEVGVPRDVLTLLPGDGASIGAALVSDPRISGVCFTGSTITAQHINRGMASAVAPEAPIIAETGGLNAMIADSTALPEQVVRDVVASSFQSAGQRCSALRMLYVQEDVADTMVTMLKGAMDMLRIGAPQDLSTDLGPVIDQDAYTKITGYIDQARTDGRLLKTLDVPEAGYFVPPSLISVNGIEDLEEEIFGPVLHVATYKAKDLDKVIDAVNAKGYGLTFGLHTRIDDKVQHVVDRVHAGNVYVNRNQIGAIVGSQPFGGEGMSGTGPKAGGPFYLQRFTILAEHESGPRQLNEVPTTDTAETETIQTALDALHKDGPVIMPNSIAVLDEISGGAGTAAADVLDAVRHILSIRLNLPGPTGESNRMRLGPRGMILCTGPDLEWINAQILQGLALGNSMLIAAQDAQSLVAPYKEAGFRIDAVDGWLTPASLTELKGIDAVACAGTDSYLSAVRKSLAERDGPILQLITERIAPTRYIWERHVCVDTTAAGGNASLLAASDG